MYDKWKSREITVAEATEAIRELGMGKTSLYDIVFIDHKES